MGVVNETSRSQGSGLESVVNTCTCLMEYLKEVREKERGRKSRSYFLGTKTTKGGEDTTRAVTNNCRGTTGTHGYHGNGKPRPLIK